MELDVSLRMNFPLVLCNNGCSAFLSLLSGRKRRPTASAIFMLFTHLAAGCQQPEMNLCSSGTWTESFFRGREREGRHTVQPVLLHCSPPSLLCWCRHCCCCCFQFLFVLNCCLCIRGQKVWVLFLFFFSKCLFCSWDFVSWRALIKAHYITALRTLVDTFCCWCLEAIKAHQKCFLFFCTG